MEDINNKVVSAPVSGGEKRHFRQWLKRLGVAGFLFFLVKGLIWLVIFYFGTEFITKLFN
jgi:hypothetical protein